jgi:hypothetical protein
VRYLFRELSTKAAEPLSTKAAERRKSDRDVAHADWREPVCRSSLKTTSTIDFRTLKIGINP